MATQHAKLRGLMVARDWSTDALAQKIGRSYSYMTARMRGNDPWDTHDIFSIVDILGIPHEEIYECFHYIPPTELNEHRNTVNKKSHEAIRRANRAKLKADHTAARAMLL